jgi:hypothetical protein
MLVSTFELLVIPITPVGPPNLARTIVQGYFLTVANTSAVSTRLRLTFRATTPNLDLLKTVVIRDVTGTNDFGELVPTSDPTVFNYDFGLPANDTALIILQPDVTIPQILTDRNLEIRGYVEINQLRSERFSRDIDVLLTPEHRGTFFSGTATAPGGDIDQLVYALPTALGKAQYTLPPVGKSIVVELTANPKPIQEGFAIPRRIQDGVEKVSDLPDPKGIAEAPSIPNLQEVLLLMAQRVDELTAAADQGSAFIQAGERPAVGAQVLSTTSNGR